MDTTAAPSVALIPPRPSRLADQTDQTDLADVPLERLEAELCTWSANLAAAEFRWFALLAEFDRREGWQQWECHSCMFWMRWQLGLDARTAREKLRVARALVGLPLIAEQMRAGRLSYSKVRAITRIAEPANEASLVAVALAGTTAQVERVVAAYRRALPPDHEASDAAQWAKRGLHVRHNDDRTITLTVTLPTAAGMEVLAAVDHFAVPAGVDPDGERLSLAERRADAVVALAGAALAATDDQLATDRPRYLVHLHTGDERQEAHPEGSEEMGSGVSDATTRRLCCDADHETVVHDTVHDTVHGDGSGPGDGPGDGTGDGGGGGEVVGVSARSSVIRGRLRRLVQLRDRTCQVPGCSHRARKEIHHLHHRGRGGTNQLGNLLLVCAYHHHRLHEGGWQAERLADGSVRFTLPNGRVIPPAPTAVEGDADAVRAFERDAADGRCKWQGDHLDLDWTLTTLFSHTPWHDPWRTAWMQGQRTGSAEPPCTPAASLATR